MKFVGPLAASDSRASGRFRVVWYNLSDLPLEPVAVENVGNSFLNPSRFSEEKLFAPWAFRNIIDVLQPLLTQAELSPSGKPKGIDGWGIIEFTFQSSSVFNVHGNGFRCVVAKAG